MVITEEKIVKKKRNKLNKRKFLDDESDEDEDKED